MNPVDPSKSDADREVSRPSLSLLVENAAATRRVPLDRPRTVVGRGDDCDVVVADPTVSRRHLAIEFDDGRVRFQDLGGTNVPLLDGRPTAAGLFPPGAVLIVGMTRLTLEVIDTPDGGSRAFDDPNRTSVIVRPGRIADAASRGMADIPATLAAIRRTPLAGPDFVQEVAHHVLSAALHLTGRTHGALVVRDPQAPLRVLAAAPADDPTAFALPSHQQFSDDSPACVAPWPDGPAALERLVVPLRPHPNIVMVLGAPDVAAPPSRAALQIAASYAANAGAELVDAERRESVARELERARFAQSYAYRTVAASARLQGLRRRIVEAATAGTPLLLLGEEGCEAQELAEIYHAHDRGSSGPFVACYARLLPANRLAQQLDSNAEIQEGAGTCDTRARGGTLFIDSPEALSPHLQERLAEALDRNRTAADDRHFCAVISMQQRDREERPGVVPALERQLGEFVILAIPPLRGFPHDVAALNEVVLAGLGPTATGEPRSLTEDAERALLAFHWPGNVRQHCRVLERAAALAGAKPIELRHLPQEVRDPSTANLSVASLREVERVHVLHVLALCEGNKTRAARKLDISPSTLHEKLRKYGHEG